MTTIRLILLCALLVLVAQPATAQSAPWGITAEGLSSSTIRLTWSYGGNSDLAGFRIERSTDGLSFTWIANVGKAAREYTDTGLLAAKTYFYRMQSYKGRRLSAYSAIASASTAATTNSTFYVDSIGGSDANSGLSTTSAWKTVAPVNSRLLAAGEIVRFKRGGSYGALTISGSGDATLPVRISDYGDASAAKPLFVPGSVSGYAIQTSSSWVIIENVLTQNAHDAGIYIAPGADHNVVQNSEMVAVGTGVSIYGQYNLVRGNYAHDLTMVVDTRGGDDDYGAVGFWIYGPNNEVAYNRCFNCKAHSYDYGIDGGVVETFLNADNAYIHHNWGEASAGFIEVGGGSARNVTVAYNVGYNNGRFACLHTDGTFAATISNFRVENNTIVEPTSTGSMFECLGAFSAGTMSLTNNVFLTPGTVFSNGSFPHVHNIYSSNPGYALSLDLERVTDPGLTDVPNKNFHLLSWSPAIDAAVDLHYTRDFDNVIVPQGAAPDIGAYEFK